MYPDLFRTYTRASSSVGQDEEQREREREERRRSVPCQGSVASGTWWWLDIQRVRVYLTISTTIGNLDIPSHGHINKLNTCSGGGLLVLLCSPKSVTRPNGCYFAEHDHLPTQLSEEIISLWNWLPALDEIPYKDYRYCYRRRCMCRFLVPNPDCWRLSLWQL